MLDMEDQQKVEKGIGEEKTKMNKLVITYEISDSCEGHDFNGYCIVTDEPTYEVQRTQVIT
jgi:hypothetical protein